MRGGLPIATRSRAIKARFSLIRLRAGPQTPSPTGEGTLYYLARSSQNATAPAAATFNESTPCCMGIMTV